MKKSRCHLLGIIILLAGLLGGCISLAPEMKDEKNVVEDQNDIAEPIGSLKVSEFILGEGDSIDISVYRNDDLKKSVKIDRSGTIMFPLIGDVKAAGKDIFVLRNEIQQMLSKYLIEPQVAISVTSVQSQKFIILGEVNSPGIFVLDSSLSIIEAISKAGGMTQDAKMGNVVLIRRKQGKAEVASLNLEQTYKEGDLSHNRMLQGGDIVYVPAMTIANVSRYFVHLTKILSPIVNLESGIVLWPQASGVLRGEEGVIQTIVAP